MPISDKMLDEIDSFVALGDHIPPNVFSDLTAEVRTLRARLVSVEAERDALRKMIAATFSHFPDCEQCGGKPVDVGAPYPVCAPCLAKFDNVESECDAANALIVAYTKADSALDECPCEETHLPFQAAADALVDYGRALLAKGGERG